MMEAALDAGNSVFNDILAAVLALGIGSTKPIA
jgi:hypothetical protein